MGVEDWAREQAERRYPAGWEDRGRTDRDDEREAFECGIIYAFDALLSDETVRKVREEIHYRLRTDHGHTTANEAVACRTCARRADVLTPIALQAAVDAVTKGENE